jgi:CHAT domain-containing protein/Tfp pilus assembly protein PilF
MKEANVRKIFTTCRPASCANPNGQRWRAIAYIIPSLAMAILPSLIVAAHGSAKDAPGVGARLAQQQSDSGNAAKSEQDVIDLEPGKPVERELTVGHVHAYRVMLAAGQLLQAVVDQRGVDVAVRVIDPNGKKLMEADGPTGPQGPERVLVVADTAGWHRLEVYTLVKGAPPGRYEIKVVAVRTATAKDRALSEALGLAYEARRQEKAGRLDEAIRLAERALAIREQSLGPDDTQVASLLNYLAKLYEDKGDYAKAVVLYQRNLAIREKASGPDDLSVATPLHNLALMYKAQGEYTKAEPLFRRALAIFETKLGPDHLYVALAADNLGGVYLQMGDIAKAAPLLERALAIREKTPNVDPLLIAGSLNNLAVLWERNGEYAKAVSLYQRALATKEKALGPEHPDVALSLGNMAGLSFKMGDYAKAKELYQRALAVIEKALGPEHPHVAYPLNDLAFLYEREGDLARAEPLLHRALAIREKAFGPNHPEVVVSLNNLFGVSRARGDVQGAVAFLARAAEAVEQNLDRNLSLGSDRQKLAYLALFANQTNNAVSLHVQFAPGDPQALRLALTTLLRRKGRGLDAMTDTIAPLRRRAAPQDRSLFDELSTARSQLASVALQGAGVVNPASYRSRLAQLEEQVEKLEGEISSRGAEFRSQQVTFAAVQAAIPKGAALVEFASYAPVADVKTLRLAPKRYIAYVLRQHGQPSWVDLGDAAAIDRAVAELRQGLRSPKRADVKRLARAADELVMRPVRGLLGQTRRIFISPEGSLNLIPFAALADEQFRYLVTRYSFTYLTSGRDLLRLQSHPEVRDVPLIVADPAFGEMAGADQQPGRNLGLSTSGPQSDFSRLYFRPLPGTAGEAQALKRVLPQAKVLAQEQATKSALKQVSGPSILHIATHGFFLEDAGGGPENTRGLGLSLASPATSPTAARIENPLLRSGLVLAGVNQHRPGDDDGILTALEVAGLDLWGTKLVVLSACNTGVGEVKNGEGVYGLRRALVLAGAESQVMSLWPVSDQGTRDLMVAYYQALQRGEGRGEALRQVQLRMLRSGTRRHPYYWASFIQSGQWKGL